MIDVPPVVGALNIVVTEIEGESYVNEETAVEVTEETSILMVETSPKPIGCLHETEVVVDQLTVVHMVVPSRTDGVKLAKAKLAPATVIIPEPVAAAFSGVWKDTTGASYEKMS